MVVSQSVSQWTWKSACQGSSVGLNLENLKSEVSGLRSEIWGLSSEVWCLRSEVRALKSELWGLKSELWRSELWSLRSEDCPVCLFLLMFDNLTAGPETGASSSPMSQISIVFTGGRHENPAGSLNEIPIITATQKWVDKICLIRVLRQDIRERRGEESHNSSQIYPLIARLSDRPRHGTLIT